MSAPAVTRGGWAGLLAAVLLVVSAVVGQPSSGAGPYAPVDYAHQGLLLLAFLAVVVAVTGLLRVLLATGRLRVPVLVAAGLTGTGYFLAALNSGVNLAAGGRSLLGMRIAASALLLVGSALLGVLALMTRVLPWWCAALLVVAFPLGDVVNQWFSSGEALLLALTWGSVGACLLRRAGKASAAPTAATTGAGRPAS